MIAESYALVANFAALNPMSFLALAAMFVGGIAMTALVTFVIVPAVVVFVAYKGYQRYYLDIADGIREDSIRGMEGLNEFYNRHDEEEEEEEEEEW